MSPDGKQIAYISNTPTESLIVAVNPEGSNRRVLARRPAALGFRYIDWSPSQDTMAAVALMNENMGIGLLSVDLAQRIHSRRQCFRVGNDRPACVEC